MPSRNKSAQAIARLQLETPFPTIQVLLNCKSAPRTTFVKPSAVIPQKPVSWYPRCWMPSQANTFAMPSTNNERARSSASRSAGAVRNDTLRRPGHRSDRLRWRLERDGHYQDRKLSADRQLSTGGD